MQKIEKRNLSDRTRKNNKTTKRTKENQKKNKFQFIKT